MRTLVFSTVLLGLFSPVAVISPANAQKAPVVLSDTEIPWQTAPTNFPKGIKIAYVYGNPANPGPFVIRVWMPAHSAIAPHTHSMDETLSVISGTFTHYIGKTYANSEQKILTAGGFVHLPRDIPHALRADDHEAVVQVSGVGPFGMTYVDPNDDPSHRK